jgi:ubiquinone/menaquinone biosynthesis C-methylase UbiE
MNIDKWNRYVHPEVNEYSDTTSCERTQEQHRQLMAVIPKTPGKVLDLGCGDGWSVHVLREMGFDAAGVTINPQEAEHAKIQYGLDLYVQDMHDLQFPDHSFDFVYCRECYEHSIAPYIALCEINRVLYDYGMTLIHIPNEKWIRENSHFSVLTPLQMREMFRKCLFKVEAEGDTDEGRWYLARKFGDI